MSSNMNASSSVNAASDLTMAGSTSSAPAIQPTQSALVSFMKHGPQSLMDDEIKPREVPGRQSTSSRAAKARIDEPDTRILSPALYPQEYTTKLKQLATLCVELDQVKQLLRDQVRRRQTGGRYKPRVRFAREVLPIDLNTVVRELKEERKLAAAVDAAVDQANGGADSAMDVDTQTPKEDAVGKGKKRAASPMDSAMEVDTQALSKKARNRRNRKAKKLAALSTDTEMKDVVGKRKRSADAEMEDRDDTQASKKPKDALDLSDLVRDLPSFSPAARLVPEITDKPLLDWYRAFPGA
ncbi:uncharacterized protein J3D65DRAFT_687925 [Phyllosticta citribraziliensis]|uniref:Uncharacterized protein n=1 Tax=Phyllosticta citribraziliensis TaxID=989973 RepID=A0ABR1L6D8_9PEZI